MIPPKIEKVLAEIFDPTALGDELPKNKQLYPPTFKELQTVAKLILADESEESFHRFFAKHPHFLFRAAPSSGDYNCGLLIKPPISSFSIADFAIFTVGQGGCGITLIEFERPSDRLFTNKLTPAQKLQGAIGQITDWNQWLTSNRQTFIATGLELLKKAPLFPKTSHNGSFRCMSGNRIEKTWGAFGGFEHCHISNLIVIGRWSKLNEKERKRLLFLNTRSQQNYLQLRTFDQLIRKGYDGPAMFW